VPSKNKIDWNWSIDSIDYWHLIIIKLFFIELEYRFR
jgi:hypothetical protein